MAHKIPCPNPACTYDFTAAEVQAGGEVCCPRCGFRLKGKGGPASPGSRTPTPPTAKSRSIPVGKPARPAPDKAPGRNPLGSTPAPTGKLPVGKPVPIARPAVPPPAPPPADEGVDVELVEAPPPEEPVEAPPPAGDDFLDAGAIGDGPLIRTQHRRRGFPIARILMGVGALVTAACLVLVAYLGIAYWFKSNDGGLGVLGPRGGYVPTIRTKSGAHEKACQIVLDKASWSTDNDVYNKIKPRPGDLEPWFTSAWKHNSEDVWIGLVIKDYGTSKPRDAEMVSVAVDKLEQVFGDGVEADVRAETTTFAGLPGQKLRYKGIFKSVAWRGECYMAFKSGFAYWFLISSPDQAAVQEWAKELQKPDVFSTQVVERRGWREQPPPSERFESTAGNFAVTGPEGIWEKSDPKSDDERGLMLLLGRYRKEKNNNRKNAAVLVFGMDPQGDAKEAMKAARADIEAKKKEENSNYKLTSAGEGLDEASGQSEVGEADEIGNRRGRISDLCLKLGDDAKRYVLVAVVNDPSVCYVFRCDCDWESRQIWRKDFLDLLHTFKSKKGE